MLTLSQESGFMIYQVATHYGNDINFDCMMTLVVMLYTYVEYNVCVVYIYIYI